MPHVFFTFYLVVMGSNDHVSSLFLFNNLFFFWHVTCVLTKLIDCNPPSPGLFHRASGMVPQKQSLRDVKHKFSKRNSRHPLIRGWNTWPVWDVENEQRLNCKWSPNDFFPAWRTVDKFMTSGFQPFCLAIISICNCVKSCMCIYIYKYKHLTSL